jgi:hypothetical protein
MTKHEFIDGFIRNYLFEPITNEVLDSLKSHIFKYIEANSKLCFEDLDTTKLVLSLPDIEDLFNSKSQDELSYKRYNYSLNGFIR